MTNPQPQPPTRHPVPERIEERVQTPCGRAMTIQKQAIGATTAPVWSFSRYISTTDRQHWKAEEAARQSKIDRQHENLHSLRKKLEPVNRRHRQTRSSAMMIDSNATNQAVINALKRHRLERHHGGVNWLLQ